MIRPIVEYEDKDWFVDIDKMELRLVENVKVTKDITKFTIDELDMLDTAVKEKVDELEEFGTEVQNLYYGAWENEATDTASKWGYPDNIASKGTSKK